MSDERIERVADAIAVEIQNHDLSQWDARTDEALARAVLAALDEEPPLEQENARLRAQVKYLRDYAIYTRAALYRFEHGAHPTEEQYQAITGGIDGNVAVAADRAAKGADDA